MMLGFDTASILRAFFYEYLLPWETNFNFTFSGTLKIMLINDLFFFSGHLDPFCVQEGCFVR